MVVVRFLILYSLILVTVLTDGHETYGSVTRLTDRYVTG